ncbi:hypothetical protein DPMN_143495 [Dreissena polymorpha]|uniref:Uncharacterized protein n=1 Tax=Dreissena polymorpha TaxID=45954 RepID=A0A9D4GGB5_DREPO|nr:hypothetical protein DPMN_143495 [Dreissena polymorpha]
MEQNTKLFMEHREKLFQENEKLQGDLSILSRSLTAAESSHGEDLQKLQVVCELYSKVYTNMWPSAFKQGKLIWNGTSDHMIIKAIQGVLEDVFQLANEECERQWKELERALKMQSKNELYPDHKDAIRRLRWATVQFVVDRVLQMWHKIRADSAFCRRVCTYWLSDESARTTYCNHEKRPAWH